MAAQQQPGSMAEVIGSMGNGAKRALAIPAVRYAGMGFALGVLATRRLGRLTRRTRPWTWRSAAVEAVTLAFALREIAGELESYGAEREMGSLRARAIVDPRGEDDRRPVRRAAISTGTTT